MNRTPVRWAGTLALLTAVLAGPARAGYIDHNFDALPFTNGATFVTPVLQWQASAVAVMVVTDKCVSATQSVLLPAGSALSNTASVAAPQTVWTEMRVLPATWGDPPEASATSGVAVVTYFGVGGYLNVWTNGGWLTCSQDVWGATVGAVDTGVWAAVAIYQNFSNHTAAVLVNDRLVVQDLPFAASFANYGAVRLFGSDYDAWIDDAYVSNTYAVARHVGDSNGLYGADAAELQTYGYVARTLYAGAGGGYPSFATIQAAVNASRPHDTVYVHAGQYAEDVTVTGSVTFGGQAFTNNGSLTVAAGQNVTFQNAVVWNNTVTVGSNAVVAFSGTVTSTGGWSVAAGATVLLSQGGSLGTLNLTGTVTVAGGQLLSLGSATVYGALVASGVSTVTVSGTLSVPAGGSGHLDFTGGNLGVPSAGVHMTGTFSITTNWGTQAPAPFDFLDNFELYAADTRLTDLGFRGWGGTDPGVVVGALQGVADSQGLTMPGGATVSNRVMGAGVAKVWMDVYVRPAVGEAPDTVVTNNRAFLSYVDTNGLLSVWTAGAWSVCGSDYGGSNLVAMSTGAYTRVTVFLNYGSRLAAVFVGDRLVRQQLPFVDGATTCFNSLWAQSETDRSALDNVRVATTPPPELLAVNPNTDLNGDGLSDAFAIHANDTISYPSGNVFRIR